MATRPAATVRKNKKLGRGRRFATGIDLGRFSVKITTLAGDDAGTIQVKKVTIVPVKRPEKQEFKEEWLTRQKEALKEAVKKHGKLEGRIVLGFPRDLATIRYLTFPSANRAELQEMVLYDVERHVPFTMEDLEISFQIIEKLGEHESRLMMVCAPTKELQPYVDLCRELGIEVHAIDLDVLGDAAVYSRSMQAGETTALVNFGRSSVKLGIIKNQILLYSRSLPIFEERLLEGFAGAKTWKDLQGRVTAAGALHPNERAHFSRWIDQLGLELMRSFSAFLCEYNGARLDRMILCGGAGYFPGGAPRGLNIRVKTKTTIEPPLNGELPPNPNYQGAEIATSLGLALRGLQKPEDTLNLLPEPFIQERSQKQKSIYRKNVAILMFMIFTLLAGTGYLFGHEKYNNRSQLNGYYRQLQDETKKLNVMRDKIDTVENYLDSKHSCLNVLQKVMETAPPQIYISSVVFTKRKTLEIIGQVFNDKEIEKLAADLISLRPGANEETYFTRVDPKTKTKTLGPDFGVPHVFDFTITCSLRWAEKKDKLR